jgi:hypothetical protein
MRREDIKVGMRLLAHSKNTGVNNASYEDWKERVASPMGIVTSEEVKSSYGNFVRMDFVLKDGHTEWFNFMPEDLEPTSKNEEYFFDYTKEGA